MYHRFICACQLYAHLILAMGVRLPRRVVGAGGLYMEYDGRDVPDVATVVADYDEGCQVLISATMCNDVQLPEVIRGHNATFMFEPKPDEGFRVVPQVFRGGPAPPGTNRGEGGEKFKPQQPGEDTRALWEHFLECTRSRNPETLCPADLGYAAITTVNLGVRSYREGKAFYVDKETGEVADADRAWVRSLGRREASSAARQIRSQTGRPARPGLCSSPRNTRSSRVTGSTARTPPHRLE